MGDSEEEMYDERPRGSKPQFPRGKKDTDANYLERILQQQQEMKAILASMQGKIETLNQGMTDLKREFLVLRRGMPNLRTEGPTGHFQMGGTS